MFRHRLLSGLIAGSAAILLAALVTPSSAVQRTVTIYQIQDTTSVGHVVEGSTDTVTTSGIITGADIRPTGFGFYIQDPAGGNFSGVQVFTGGANTFSDSGYARGDIIQATGRVLEFSGGTELASASGSAFGTPPHCVKLGSTAVPTPLTVSFSQLNELAAYSVGEKYECVLLSLTGNGRTARYPIFANGVSGSFPANQYLIVDNGVVNPLDSVRVDGQTLAFPAVSAPAIGVVVSSVKGLGTQTALGYGIQLRDDADIVQPSPPTLLSGFATANSNIHLIFDRNLDPVTSQVATNYTRNLTLKQVDAATLSVDGNSIDLTTNVQPQVPGESEQIVVNGVKSALGQAIQTDGIHNTKNFIAGVVPITAVQTYLPVSVAHPAPGDTSQYIGQEVTTRGIVTAINQPSTYYYQSGNTINPSSGMIIFAPIASMDQGDDATVAGFVTEFGTASQATEFSGLDYQFINATGATLPTPVVATPGQVGPIVGNKPYPGEAYEGMLVQLNNVFVAQDSLPNGQYLVQGNGGTGDTVRVDDTIYHHIYKAGTFLDKLIGVVNDAFGQFVLNPRSASDVDSLGVLGVSPGASATEFAIRSITPNPVSFAHGTTTIHFRLPTAGKVSARIYDVNGRLIASPAKDVVMAAGSQTLVLNGTELNRRSSGIFFVELRLGNKVATGKLVVTE